MKRLMACSALIAVVVATPLFATAERNDRAVTVMTRNMYFGADLTPAIEATTVPELITAVTEIFATVQNSDIPARIDRMADEIAATAPDLVGLQEVALWRTQFPPDFAPTPNATTVEFDFLTSLLTALAARGLEYTVVATHVTNDLEAPALMPGVGCCREIRFTDREVLLAKTSRHHNDPIAISNAATGTFAAQVGFMVPGAAGEYVEKRGWVAADVAMRGAHFRFISTHLLPEGSFDPVQVAQGLEILGGPANALLPVIFVCDCNSRADGTGTMTYAAILSAGFSDAWSARRPHDPGLTCCQEEDLLNPVSAFDRRIDLVTVRGAAHVRDARVVGDTPEDRTEAERWPSDHAGVVATIEFRP